MGVPLESELRMYIVAVRHEPENNDKAKERRTFGGRPEDAPPVKFFRDFEHEYQVVHYIANLEKSKSVITIMQVTDAGKVTRMEVVFKDGKLKLKPLEEDIK